MARSKTAKKDTGAAAGAEVEDKEQGNPPTPPPSAPRFRYVGPAGSEIVSPTHNVTFRPLEMTEAQIGRLIKTHPALARYWEDGETAS